MGYSWISPSHKLRRWLPEYDPNLPWLACTKLVDCKGIRYKGSADPGTGWGKINQFKSFDLTFEYGFRNYDELSDDELDSEHDGNEFFRYTSFTMQPSAEYLTLPAGALRWAPEAGTAPNGLIPFTTGRVQYMASVQYKWWMVPFKAYIPGSPLDDFIQATVGRVNNDDFDGFRANTLLLESVVPQQVRGPTGEFYWNFEYNMKFLAGDGGHNTLLARFTDSADGKEKLKRVLVTTDGVFYPPGSLPTADNQATLYLEADFNNLWKVDF